MITKLEELSLNAFPALQTFLYDGWILRFSNGYSRRANSIQTFGLSQPLRAPQQALAEKIAYCEKMYHARNLPVVFKMTRAAQPAQLDAELETRGYQFEADTIVQTCALDSFGAARKNTVCISETWSEEWFTEFARMSNFGAKQSATLKQMLQMIVPQTGFAMLRDGTGVCACGLGVRQENYLGLFDIVVDRNVRRRGYGKQIVTQLMVWGKHNGAQLAYLQVIANNIPALCLYEQLGFVEHYPYWYRVHI